MAKSKCVIVLDTNWYVSATINRVSRQKLYQIFVDKSIEILVCKELIEEYRAVIGRPKFKKYIKPHQASRFIQFLLPKLTTILLKSSVKISRDAKDDFLLALSNEGKAAYLITGDPDLLVLKEFACTKIVTMSEFLQERDR